MTDWRNLKRFYKEAAAIKMDDGFSVALDGKPIKTPGKRNLVVPVEAIADAIAREWQEQGETIDVPAMAMLRLAATSIDRVAINREEVDEVTLKFAETDLLCYRAGEPPELVARQIKSWQPLLDWAASYLQAPLVITDGIVPVIQPHEALSGLGAALTGLSDLEVTAVSGIAAATGSLVIGFAVKHGRLSPEDAADIGLLDELFQMEQWGEDEITQERHSAIRQEINESARFLELLF
ncbi:MAG: ATP12 family protein [Rhodospirillales bacterium]|nr:ATP12 family protein [Rhodospirillales bacterium]